MVHRNHDARTSTQGYQRSKHSVLHHSRAAHPAWNFLIIVGWGLDFAVARGLESLLIGVVSAALALWLILGKSRVAAVGLVILSCILVVSGIIAIFVIKAGGGGGGVVAVIALFAAAKAVEATFKLSGLAGRDQ